MKRCRNKNVALGRKTAFDKSRNPDGNEIDAERSCCAARAVRVRGVCEEVAVGRETDFDIRRLSVFLSECAKVFEAENRAIFLKCLPKTAAGAMMIVNSIVIMSITEPVVTACEAVNRKMQAHFRKGAYHESNHYDRTGIRKRRTRGREAAFGITAHGVL